MELSALKELIKDATRNLFHNNKDFWSDGISERTLCGALMIEIHDLIKERPNFAGYYVDVEYNRYHISGDKKVMEKYIMCEDIKRISCDLIVHNRGKDELPDNLIVLEMKKSNASHLSENRNSDRKRLQFMTSIKEFEKDNNWIKYHYDLGVYFEFNKTKEEVYLEYWNEGEMEEQLDCYDLNTDKYRNAKKKWHAQV